MTSFPLCVKTPKGIEEVERKAHGLALKARQVLIMVDGKRDVEALETIFPPGSVAPVLTELLAGGFIRALEPVAPAPVTTAAHAAPSGSATVSLQPAREAFSSALYDVFGPDADNFTIHVDKAKSVEELSELATRYQEVVAKMGGRRKADGFVATLRAAGILGTPGSSPQAPAPPPGPVTVAVEPPKSERERLDMARQFMINTATTFSGVAKSSLIVQLEQAQEIRDLRALYYDWREALQMSSSGRQRLPDLERRAAALLS